MAVTLPQGWTISGFYEAVPDPNGVAAPFARFSYVCTDEHGVVVAASGSQQDCEAQALTLAQSRTQQRPYTGGH